MQKIMFDDLYNLTQAVVKGRKTVTRRIIPEDFFTLNWDRRGDTLVYENANGEFIDIRDSKYCKYKVGEYVAIAQRYKDIAIMQDEMFGTQYFLIGENRVTRDEIEAGWNNKLFVKSDLMHHCIKITNIRVERLQDITLEECLREGIVYAPNALNLCQYYLDRKGKIISLAFQFARDAFAYLIDHAGGKSKGTWAANPWVFVYEFKLLC